MGINPFIISYTITANHVLGILGIHSISSWLACTLALPTAGRRNMGTSTSWGKMKEVWIDIVILWRFISNFSFKSFSFPKAFVHRMSFLVSRFNFDKVGHQIRHFFIILRFDFRRIHARWCHCQSVVSQNTENAVAPCVVDFSSKCRGYSNQDI